MKPRRVKVEEIRVLEADSATAGVPIYLATLAFVTGWGPWRKQHTVRLAREGEQSYSWRILDTGESPDGWVHQKLDDYLQARELIKEIEWRLKKPKGNDSP